MRQKMDEKQAARMERLTEEFYHPDNFLFFTQWHPSWCVLCDLYFRESEIFASFEELVYHLDCFHVDEDCETKILAQEGILKVILAHKRVWETQHGRFSN